MLPKLGITFSQPHLENLGLSVSQALTTALELQFSHLRLGAYWNRLERQPGEYDFTELGTLLRACEKANQPVVLTVGVKAPRWPEYYWPDFIDKKHLSHPDTQAQVLLFMDRVVRATQSFSCITHWQVENEPFDPSGPDQLAIPEEFLNQEIQRVKELDPRPIIITLWGNEVGSRGFFPQAEKMADVVGLDLYYKQFIYQVLGRSLYRGPQQSQTDLTKLIKSGTKPVWITELQAEPWEKDEAGYKSLHPMSISPEQLEVNLSKAQSLPVEEILLWGFEYWLWRANQNDLRYLEMVRRFPS
jgi:hypothetical protein